MGGAGWAPLGTDRRPHTLLSPDVRATSAHDRTYSSRFIKKEDDSSQSSNCVVDTTTKGCSEEAATWKGL